VREVEPAAARHRILGPTTLRGPDPEQHSRDPGRGLEQRYSCEQVAASDAILAGPRQLGSQARQHELRLPGEPPKCKLHLAGHGSVSMNASPAQPGH
jgi:hypothetical protein